MPLVQAVYGGEQIGEVWKPSPRCAYDSCPTRPAHVRVLAKSCQVDANYAVCTCNVSVSLVCTGV